MYACLEQELEAGAPSYRERPLSRFPRNYIKFSSKPTFNWRAQRAQPGQEQWDGLLLSNSASMCPDLRFRSSSIVEKESVMKLSRVGVDLAKNVYQLHGVDRHGKPIWKRRLRRGQWLQALLDKSTPTLLSFITDSSSLIRHQCAQT